jgi:hypothetical protein
VTEKVLAAKRIAANFPRHLNPSIQLTGDSGCPKVRQDPAASRVQQARIEAPEASNAEQNGLFFSGNEPGKHLKTKHINNFQ